MLTSPRQRHRWACARRKLCVDYMSKIHSANLIAYLCVHLDPCNYMVTKQKADHFGGSDLFVSKVYH